MSRRLGSLMISNDSSMVCRFRRGLLPRCVDWPRRSGGGRHSRQRSDWQARPDEISLVEEEAHVLFTAQLCAWNAERFDDCRRWSEQLAREIGGFLAPPRVAALTAPQRDFLTKMVCMGLTRLSQLAEMAGRIDAAIDWTERRRQLSLELLADLPASAIDPRLAELLHADLRLAELLERSGRSTEAEEILSQVAAIAVRLHDAEPAVWEHASLLALICQSRAKLADGATTRLQPRALPK